MADNSRSVHLFADVLARVHAICAALAAEGNWPAGIDFARVVVEPPRDASHGDMATNAAMVLAKDAKAKPRELADKIADKLRSDAWYLSFAPLEKPVISMAVLLEGPGPGISFYGGKNAAPIAAQLILKAKALGYFSGAGNQPAQTPQAGSRKRQR